MCFQGPYICVQHAHAGAANEMQMCTQLIPAKLNKSIANRQRRLIPSKRKFTLIEIASVGFFSCIQYLIRKF